MKLKVFPDRDRFDELARTSNVIPVCREILADMETPVSLLKKCYHNDNGSAWAPIFLLESVEGGEKWGRYSFLGTSARAHVKVFGEAVTISDDRGSEQIPPPG